MDCQRTAMDATGGGMPYPKISFGMIVLNGLPFLTHNLRALYPFAHQIVVAEGASPMASAAATADGHSMDGTLEALYRFKEQEDPYGKLTIVTAEDEGHLDGFWPGEKHEQSQAYAKRASGDWLWQVDVDEFYRERDLLEIAEYLTKTSATVLFFYLRGFMYHPRLEAVGVHPEYSRCQPVPRIFRWGPGYRYLTHRPPTVVDAQGVDLKLLRPTLASETASRGWYAWHYSYLYRNQFRAKAAYYDRQPFRAPMGDWAKSAETMSRPRLAVLWQGLSWLQVCSDGPPEAVTAMVSERMDYAVPEYVNGRLYLAVTAVLWIYVSALRWVRCEVFRRRWFLATYHRSRLEMAERQQPGAGQSLLRKLPDVVRRSLVFRFGRFMGWYGYSAF